MSKSWCDFNACARAFPAHASKGSRGGMFGRGRLWMLCGNHGDRRLQGSLRGKSLPHVRASSFALSCSLVVFAPTIWSFTSPFLKNRSNGMDRTLYLTARSRASSTLTLTIFACPSISLESWSSIGPIILHGPHHSAQKSTRTGWSESNTSTWKLASVTLMDIHLV